MTLTPHSRAARARELKRGLAVFAGIIALLFLIGGWIGVRALNANAAIDKAQSLLDTLKTQARGLDLADLGDTSNALSESTREAVDQTHDPLWQAAEHLPYLGNNLLAVRQMAEAVDSVSHKTVAPIATIASTLGVASLRPVNGRISLAPLKALEGIIDPATTSLHGASATVSAIDLSRTIPPIRDAGHKLSAMFSKANASLADLRSISSTASAMLGAKGPRTYVLVFQNLAETTALGGTAAALSAVTVDDGAITLTRQASSTDFPWQDGRPVIPADPKLSSLFTPLFYTRLNLSTSRPDFPTAALITQAFWQQRFGGTVDGVISIDPGALAQLLGATGPVALSTGDTLTSANAVPLLLNTIYFRYQGPSGPARTDAFFAEVARTMFGALMKTDADPKVLLATVIQGVNEHRILAWSSHPAEQKLIAKGHLDGVLPADNTKSTTTGVFFRDMSASKMDYYLTTAAKLTTDVCTATTPTFTVAVELHSKLTPAEAATLPSYIASGPWGAKQFRTQVFVYGPPGSTIAAASVNSAGVSTTLGDLANDLGRPVVSFWVMLAPGQSSTVTATFAGAAGTYAPPELRTTPMLNPTAVTIDAAGCRARN
ncbi:MAG: hypothetical protein QOH55_1993 [Microbacteriaceae bacterium]|nr:hypothetical protein [Microbacteriaceae bacterium]